MKSQGSVTEYLAEDQRPWRDLHIILRNVIPPHGKRVQKPSKQADRPPGVWSSPLTGDSPTSAGGQGAAPLAIAPTLGSGRTLQQVAGAAGEVHHIVQVELAAVGQPMGGVPRVSTGDGYGGRQAHMVVRRRTSHHPHLEFFIMHIHMC